MSKLWWNAGNKWIDYLKKKLKDEKKCNDTRKNDSLPFGIKNLP